MPDKISAKRIQIDRANAIILIFMGTAAFLTTFCIVASHSLLTQRSYQARVITQKKKSLNQLNANVKALDSLKASYADFQNKDTNIIGGKSQCSTEPKTIEEFENLCGDKDGDNARIILDALPSKYDFPALATSLEKILSDPNYTINSIVGKDDEVTQHASDSTTPVEIPFEMEVTGKYAAMTNLITTLDRSIRPFKATSITYTAQEDQKVQVTYKGITYFLPEKVLKITTQDVK